MVGRTTQIAACLLLTAISSVSAFGCTAPTQPPKSPKADAAKTCAILEACLPKEWDQLTWRGSLAACTSDPRTSAILPTPGDVLDPVDETGAAGPAKDIYACVLATGGDCAKVAACLAPRGGGACTSPAGLTAGTCQGTKLAGCTAEGYPFEVDCGTYGEACGQAPSGPGTLQSGNACGFSACSDMSGDHCEGTTADVCGGGTMLHVDCATSGGTCAPISNGFIGCAGTGACNTAPEPYCQGSVVVSCTYGQTALHYDCARQPTLRRCENGQCAPTDTACRLDMPETCEGSKIRFCDDGDISTIDCAALGFAGCQGGRCVPKTTKGCAPGWIDCSGTCAEVWTDPDHCGSCANRCAPDQICVGGYCAYPDCRTTHCGPYGYCRYADHTCVCTGGAHLCGGRCVAPDDPTACGPSCTDCPRALNMMSTCTNGTCGLECLAGYHLCGSDCVSSEAVATCGTRCTPCPAPAAHGTVTCMSRTCITQCDAGYHASGTDCVAN